MIVSDIRRLIADGSLDEAQRQLGSQGEAGPLPAELRLLQADVLQKKGDGPGAIALLRVLIGEEPDNLAALVRLIRLLRDSGGLAEAREHFINTVWDSGLKPEEMDRLVNQLTSGSDATPEASLDFLQVLDEGDATRLVVRVRRAAFLAQTGRSAEALENLDRAAATGKLPPYAATTHFELMMAAGRTADAADTARRLMQVEPKDTRHAERLAIAAIAQGEPVLAAKTLEAAFAQNPDDWWLLFRFNRIAFAPQIVERMYAVAARQADRIKDPRGAFQYALLCLEQGRIDAALPILSRIQSDASVGSMARPLVRALHWLKPADAAPPRYTEDRRLDVRTLPCPGADTAIIVFSGMLGRFGYLPMSQMDGFMAGYRAHLIYLNDVQNAAYLRGLPSFGGREDETVAGLAAVLRDLGARRVVTVGAALGGFGAARYGARLQANAVLSLGGPVVLDPAGSMTDVPVEMRAALSRLAKRYDIVEDLQASPVTRLVYAYTAGRPDQTSQARRLAGLPGLVERPVEGSDNAFTAMVAVGRGLLPGLMEDLGLARK